MTWEEAIEAVQWALNSAMIDPDLTPTSKIQERDRIGTEIVAKVRLAARAEEVMLKRGWGVKNSTGGWLLIAPDAWYSERHLYPLLNERYADPFSCLVESEKWYKINIEKKP